MVVEVVTVNGVVPTVVKLWIMYSPQIVTLPPVANTSVVLLLASVSPSNDKAVE